MNYIFLVIILLILVIIFCPSKEKFKQLNYPKIQKYHQDSYNHGLHGKKSKKLHFGCYSDYIPIVKYILL